MALTKGQITRIALQELDRRGAHAWPQNNARTRAGYVFRGLKGVSDILGYYRQTGVIVVCEVKTINDRLSDVQITFLSGVARSGGQALIATEDKTTGNVVLMSFVDYLNK